MTERPATDTAPMPAQARTEPAPPSLETWIALAVAAIPQVAAIVFGGYPKLVVILPVALTLTFASGAGLVVAVLQILADRRAQRPTHMVVWATIILAAPWIAYALYVGAIALLVRVFCINASCRGPLG